MSFNLNQFRANLKYGGARPTLFRVTMSFPTYVPDSTGTTLKAAFTIKAAQLPASNVGMIEAPYFGRVAKMPGDRTFEDWTGTIINDEDFKVRNGLELWHNGMNKINQGTNSLRDLNIDDLTGYVQDVKIEQFGKGGNIVKTYILKNAWPINIGPIQLGWENRDQIEEFDVTFAYDYFVTEQIR